MHGSNYTNEMYTTVAHNHTQICRISGADPGGGGGGGWWLARVASHPPSPVLLCNIV